MQVSNSRPEIKSSFLSFQSPNIKMRSIFYIILLLWFYYDLLLLLDLKNLSKVNNFSLCIAKPNVGKREYFLIPYLLLITSVILGDCLTLWVSFCLWGWNGYWISIQYCWWFSSRQWLTIILWVSSTWLSVLHL